MGEIISMSQHGAPDIPVEVMDGAPGANEERLVSCRTKRPQSGTHGHVEMRVEEGVHTDDGSWGASFGEHADENEVSVMDPFTLVRRSI